MKGKEMLLLHEENSSFHHDQELAVVLPLAVNGRAVAARLPFEDGVRRHVVDGRIGHG